MPSQPDLSRCVLDGRARKGWGWVPSPAPPTVRKNMCTTVQQFRCHSGTGPCDGIDPFHAPRQLCGTTSCLATPPLMKNTGVQQPGRQLVVSTAGSTPFTARYRVWAGSAHSPPPPWLGWMERRRTRAGSGPDTRGSVVSPLSRAVHLRRKRLVVARRVEPPALPAMEQR
eukprot:gene532-biopygen22631